MLREQTTVLLAVLTLHAGQVPDTRPGPRLPPNLLNRLHMPGAFNGQTQDVTPSSGDTVLYNLQNYAPQGTLPQGGLLLGEDGAFYGTTYGGGVGFGLVYQIDRSGRERVLYSFTGGSDGADPIGNLISDPAGNLYGVTSGGGNFAGDCAANGCGVVFKLDKSGKETVLHTFLGGTGGAYPSAGLVRDYSGNLFGVCAFCGADGSGLVFKLDSSGNETVLHTFTGAADGGLPFGSLILDPAGNLYGTAVSGGTASSCFSSGCGVVFKLDKYANETVLYNFTGGTDGASPNANLSRDSAGNLYGTAFSGGNLSFCGGEGCGVVFKLDPAGNETVLYSFTGKSDGGGPLAGVASDDAGSLYGTTQNGGDLTKCAGSGCGVVFKLNKLGKYTVLHAFEGGLPGSLTADGSGPNVGVILDCDGNISGATAGGGLLNFGVVYTLDRTGKEIMAYGFPSSAGGSQPYGGVTPSSAGDLIGTTSQGGSYDDGVVYKLDPWGSETVLHTFTGGPDGAVPQGVILDSFGDSYGTTGGGGDLIACPFSGSYAGCGVIFKLDSIGKETVLHSFTGADGNGPIGSLVRDPADNFFGATYTGGNMSACYGTGCGVIFKLDAAGNFTILHTFMGGIDGGYPAGNLIRDPAGNLYGVARIGGNTGCYGNGCGFVFKLDPSGNETVLYAFQGGTDGQSPGAGLIRDSSGNLYGTTAFGGASNAGVIFKLDTHGNETVLYSFTGTTDGAHPVNASLVRDSAGNLYGTTPSGGDLSGCSGNGCGVVFQLNPSGIETVLHAFTGASDGSGPSGSLLLDPTGNLVGTAATGGKYQGGVVFKVPK